MPSFGTLGIEGDSKLHLELQRFGQGLIRDYKSFQLRQPRRSEGVYSPAIERKARILAKRYNLSLPRARLLASLDGGAE